MKLAKIVSGAQTGADRGGLEAAVCCGLECGGWVPKGWKAEDGVIPAKYMCLGLRETVSEDYIVRTEANVVDSDATVIFTRGKLEVGSLKTADFARKHNRPLLHVALAKSRSDQEKTVRAVVRWLRADCPDGCALNVAGQRESKSPGIQRAVMVRMVDITSTVNRLGHYPLSDDRCGPDSGNAAPGPVAGVRIGEPGPCQGNDVPERFRHPKTVDEAVAIVIDALPAETKEEIRKSSDRELFRLACHFSLTMWVRNLLIHQNKNLIDLYADFRRGRSAGRWYGKPEPDDISGAICGQLWERLHSGT